VSSVCVCRWIQRPGSVAYQQLSVYCSACDRQKFQSSRNPVILSSSQQSPAIPKQLSTALFTDVRWQSFYSAYAAQSHDSLKCIDIDSLLQCRSSASYTVPVLRLLHTTPRGQREPESKVEETLEALKDSVKKTPGDTMVTEAKITQKVTEVEDLSHPSVADAVITPEKKKTLWARFKAELVHYYHGFRLLFIDIRVAVRLIWQVLKGRSLVRRERQQVSFKLTELLVNVSVICWLLPVLRLTPPLSQPNKACLCMFPR